MEQSFVLKDNNKNIQFNHKNIIDGIELLNCIPDKSLKVIFFDPQYRGVLDKMEYGNEGKTKNAARSAIPQMTEEIIHNFLNEIYRVLNKSGYLFLWVDKFHVCEGIKLWLKDFPDFNIVDLITWNKRKIGMGYRTRRTCEYLVVIQKTPTLAKKTWVLHNIPDVWDEKVKKTHPHSKPIGLQTQLILATTNEGDFVCDPASGGFSVFECCKLTNRNFIGGDIKSYDDYNVESLIKEKYEREEELSGQINMFVSIENMQ